MATTKALMASSVMNAWEIFYSLKEAQVVIEQWRDHYNTRRPHSALGYRPPAPAAIIRNHLQPRATA
jgi:transposase InsO family protein